jgi:potassium uptake TrkH family protein
MFILHELTTSPLKFYQLRMNPSLLFILSFLGIILIGSLLLMLPRATTHPIAFLDALFTATSAVCVTGLIVLDTAKDFTPLGQGIILGLLQLGGLGIITFTYFFGYFFQGSASFQSTIYIKNMVSAENIGSTLRVILRIVGVTFTVEAIGALAIWLLMRPDTLGSTTEDVAFSIFHAISAFCNAGFSTLSQGLFDARFRTEYGVQIVIMVLVLIGGIGFPSINNLGTWLKHQLRELWGWFWYRRPRRHLPRLIRLDSILAINTSLMLLLGGFLAVLLFEQRGILAGAEGWFGEAVTAAFATVTPRTAGFNTFDLMELSLPTILMMMALMWIGASPNSTGGGIKTTTFAVALLNILNIAAGKDRMEIQRREIAVDTVYKAFAIIFLSLLLILSATILLTFTEPNLPFQRLVFEVFSAVGTVGLTLGVTGKLSSAGKIVIMFCMFIGRVGALTIITGLVRKVSSLRYQYPREELKVG